MLNIFSAAVQKVTAKFQSKREIYKFLSCECKSYLDNYEAMTIW